MTIYVILLLGLFLYSMQMIVVCRFMYQCLKFGRHKTVSGTPIVGSLLLSLGFYLWGAGALISGIPIAVELFVSAVAWFVASRLKASRTVSGDP